MELCERWDHLWSLFLNLFNPCPLFVGQYLRCPQCRSSWHSKRMALYLDWTSSSHHTENLGHPCPPANSRTYSLQLLDQCLPWRDFRQSSCSCYSSKSPCLGSRQFQSMAKPCSWQRQWDRRSQDLHRQIEWCTILLATLPGWWSRSPRRSYSQQW